MFWIFVVILIVIVFLIQLLRFSLPRKIECDFNEKHVFITGGSKGIGKAIAVEVLKRGCKTVSIAARGVESLQKAAVELTGYAKQAQTVKWFELDLSNGYEKIAKVVENAENESGKIDILINNAGSVYQGGFDEMEIDCFEKQIKTNYLSAVYTTRAVISGMKKHRQGHLAFVSSAAGQCAIWGYSAYSPSKFALRGFAETLHMELLPYNVGVSILFPPNTNTEGFQQELKEMPEEVRLISNSAGIFSAKEIATVLVDNMAAGNFAITSGLEGWMLGVLTAGAAPEPNIFKAITQCCLCGILRLIMLVYNGSFNRIVQTCHRAKSAKID